MQAHNARRAGKHFDFRVVDPDGKAHSWAGRKPLPSPGEGTYVFRQGTHTKDYALGFEGEIQKGYGAGTVRMARREPAEVLEADDRHVRFNLYTGRVPEQFFMKRMGEKRWLLRNITPTRDVQKWQALIPSGRPRIKEKVLEDLPIEDPKHVMQPKIDGAQGIAVLEPGKHPRIFSYREAKNETGLIEHSHKFPDFWKPSPKELGTTVVRGEITAFDKDGRTIPAEQVGGILNSSVWNSRDAQKEQGVRLGFVPWRPERFKGKNVGSRPYGEKLEMLREISGALPQFREMPTARTTKEKQEMLQRILAGEEPLTREGVVSHNIETDEIIKGKKKSDFDVYVREILPGKKPGEAGAFRFSHTPKGKIVGKVGTGFSQELRKEMLADPGEFIGRAAKVEAQQRYGSGALRAPVFTGEWHLDKGRQPFVEAPGLPKN